jgi:sterol desaturase/sphingolipid hydroxylase (fatty acid hydroxylase superfamily)
VIAAIAVGAGAVSWTLLEYLIHRWMGHDRRFKRTPFGIEHVRHHIEGDYFAPTAKKVLVAGMVAVVIGAPVIAVAGRAGIGYVAGLLGCYAVYEVVHRREHTHAGIGWYGRWARRHHFHHHFVDGRKNHGVTTPIWDWVFGTYERSTIIRVPRKLCMAWLLDPDTGDVRAQHAATYQLRAS